MLKKFLKIFKLIFRKTGHSSFGKIPAPQELKNNVMKVLTKGAKPSNKISKKPISKIKF